MKAGIYTWAEIEGGSIGNFPLPFLGLLHSNLFAWKISLQKKLFIDILKNENPYRSS